MVSFSQVLTTLSIGLVSLPVVAAELRSGAAGVELNGVRCANLSTGTAVQSPATTTEWDCIELGLVVQAGDRIVVSVRGRVAAGARSVLGGASVAPLFVKSVIFDDGDMGYDAADFDLDGDQDVLMADNFRWLEHLAGDPPSFAEHSLEAPGTEFSASDVRAADFNLDGRPDIAASFSVSGRRILWYRNLPGSPPTFQERLIYAEAGRNPRLFEVGDVDGDGDPDVVSWSNDTDDTPPMLERLAWHENQGASFITHLMYEVESSEFFSEIVSAIGDLDGDGDADVAAADCASGRTLWFENDGTTPPGFTMHVIDPDFEGTEIQLADFDQDGDLDVMTGMELDHRLRFYENAGGDPLGFVVHERSEEDFQGPNVADLNADSRPDVFLQWRFEPNDGFGWLENLGGFVFAPHVTGGVEGLVFDEGVFVDLESNGDLDFVTTNSGAGGDTIRIEAKQTVGAWIENVQPQRALCRNLTSGQSVQDASPDDGLFDCQALGLSVSPGDQVQITVRGVAD
jgi:hypothetical protein